MKKSFFVCIFLLFTSMAFAEFEFGIKAGYTTSLSISNFNLSDYSIRNDLANGFHAGVLARMGKRLYFQPEVLYNRQKNTSYITIDEVEYSRELTINTLDVPLLLGFKLFDLKALNMRLCVGPKVSFNVGSKSSFNDINLVDEFRKARFGVEAGVGLEFFNLINLDVRYNLVQSITKEFKFSDIKTAAYDPSNTFLVAVGIVF